MSSSKQYEGFEMDQSGPMSKYNTKICAVKRHLTFFEECQNIKSGYLQKIKSWDNI